MMAADMKEWQGLPDAELQQRILQSRQELASLRLRASQGALERPHEIRQRRRDIARMLTVLNQAHRSAPQTPTTTQPPQPARRPTTRRSSRPQGRRPGRRVR